MSYAILGLIAGIFSGVVGVGGGMILVPALVFIFKMSQHQAQGTTLALMIPPIGLLAVLDYYKHGYVDIKAAAFICLGFFIGGFFGAKIANHISNEMLSKIFGLSMVVLGLKMILGK